MGPLRRIWPALLGVALTVGCQADKEPAVEAMVVSVTADRSERLWYGLNGSGQLVSLFAAPNGAEFSSCYARDATPAEVEEIQRLTRDAELFDAPRDIEGPAELEMRPPGLALTRIRLWQGDRDHEISISGIAHAPESIRDYAQRVKDLCEAGSPVEVPAVVWSVDLSRTFGPDNMTYAALYRNAGREFVAWKDEDLVPAVRRVLTWPGTVEVLSDEDGRWLADRLPGEEPEIYVEVGGRPFRLHLFQADPRHQERHELRED